MTHLSPTDTKHTPCRCPISIDSTDVPDPPDIAAALRALPDGVDLQPWQAEYLRKVHKHRGDRVLYRLHHVCVYGSTVHRMTYQAARAVNNRTMLATLYRPAPPAPKPPAPGSVVHYRRIQAKDLADVDFLRSVERARLCKSDDPEHWHSADDQRRSVVSRWELQRCQFPTLPEKVVWAKARKLIRRGFLDGCECPCRGDYRLTDKGRTLVSARS